MKVAGGYDKVTDDQFFAAEQVLIGSILNDASCVDQVADVITIEQFTLEVHARIWMTCLRRHQKAQEINVQTIYQIFKDNADLSEVKPQSYFVNLAGRGVSARLVRDYAITMRDGYTRRTVQDAVAAAGDNLRSGDDTEEVVAGLQQSIAALPEVAGKESSVSLTAAATSALSQAKEAFEGNAVGLTTGIGALDKVIKKLMPGDLMLLGGTTSMGKTATAIQIADNVCRDGVEGGVVFISLEMEPEDIVNRMISSRSGVPYSSIRDASTLDESDFKKYAKHAGDVINGAMRIVPKHIRDMPGIHAAVRRAGNDMGVPVRLIVVDYAQLVRGAGNGRYEQMTNVSIGLKALAGLMGCPVVALVQLDRKIGDREDRRPQLSDIKETGQFENDADQVVFCHREDYWLRRFGPRQAKDGSIPNSNRVDYEADLAAAKNKIELIVRKNRHGKIATAEVGAYMPTNKFWDLGNPPPDQQDIEF